MNIVICDDDKEFLAELECLIEGILINNKSNSRIVLSTVNPNDVISYISRENSVALYFLDISFDGEIKGMDIANLIRKRDDKSQIVFITNYPDNIPLTFEYKLRVLDFITKANHIDCRRKIEECINIAEQRQQTGYADCINVYNFNNYFSIPYNKILYIDTIPNSHKLLLHSNSSVHQFYGNIKDILRELDDRFIRCHKSFIVNKDKIIGINKRNRSVILCSGHECPYSLKLFNPNNIF